MPRAKATVVRFSLPGPDRPILIRTFEHVLVVNAGGVAIGRRGKLKAQRAASRGQSKLHRAREHHAPEDNLPPSIDLPYQRRRRLGSRHFDMRAKTNQVFPRAPDGTITIQ